MQGRFQFAFPRLTPLVKKLIITLLGAYVLELILMNFVGVPVFSLFALTPANFGIQTLWQLFTYVLVEPPSAVFSMLIGLLFLWLIISPFEVAYGPRRTMQLCITGVLSAGLLGLLVGVLVPNPALVTGPAILFGSGPIAYAGISAMAMTVRSGRLSFFGVFPMTGQQLLMLIAGISLLMYLASGNHVMFAGSLGAIAGGVGFIRWMRRPRNPGGSQPKRKRGPSGFRVVDGGLSDEPRDPSKWLN